MKILPYKYVRLNDTVGVWVSNHYYPTLFGVHSQYMSAYRSGQFVETGAPGTGFFVRITSSHSYQRFVREQRFKLEPRYGRMLMGREFDFDRSLAAARKALEGRSVGLESQVLESYINVLTLGKEAEELERIIRALKNKTHKRNRRRHLTDEEVSLLSSCKSRVAQLNHDARGLCIDMKDYCTEERYALFADAVKAFVKMSDSHRIYYVSAEEGTDLDDTFTQVFFDLGMFDFIQQEALTPVLRTPRGVNYYLYPNCVIEARSVVDFKIHPMEGLHFRYGEMPADTVSTAVLGRNNRHLSHSRVAEDTVTPRYFVGDQGMAQTSEAHGHKIRVLGELSIPELGLKYLIRDNAAALDFAKKMSLFLEKGQNV